MSEKKTLGQVLHDAEEPHSDYATKVDGSYQRRANGIAAVCRAVMAEREPPKPEAEPIGSVRYYEQQLENLRQGIEKLTKERDAAVAEVERLRGELLKLGASKPAAPTSPAPAATGEDELRLAISEAAKDNLHGLHIAGDGFDAAHPMHIHRITERIRPLFDAVRAERDKYKAALTKTKSNMGDMELDLYGQINALEQRAESAEAERDKLRVAISVHRSQKADDRCIEDDDRLYEALGDGIKCDRRVGSMAAMLSNCQRFIANRCVDGGPWKSYVELEAERDKLAAELREVREAVNNFGRRRVNVGCHSPEQWYCGHVTRNTLFDAMVAYYVATTTMEQRRATKGKEPTL